MTRPSRASGPRRERPRPPPRISRSSGEGSSRSPPTTTRFVRARTSGVAGPCLDDPVGPLRRGQASDGHEQGQRAPGARASPRCAAAGRRARAREAPASARRASARARRRLPACTPSGMTAARPARLCGSTPSSRGISRIAFSRGITARPADSRVRRSTRRARNHQCSRASRSPSADRASVVELPERVEGGVRIRRRGEHHRDAQIPCDAGRGEGADVAHAQVDHVERALGAELAADAALHHHPVLPGVAHRRRRHRDGAERGALLAGPEGVGEGVGAGAAAERQHPRHPGGGGEGLAEEHQQAGDAARVADAGPGEARDRGRRAGRAGRRPGPAAARPPVPAAATRRAAPARPAGRPARPSWRPGRRASPAIPPRRGRRARRPRPTARPTPRPRRRARSASAPRWPRAPGRGRASPPAAPAPAAGRPRRARPTSTHAGLRRGAAPAGRAISGRASRRTRRPRPSPPAAPSRPRPERVPRSPTRRARAATPRPSGAGRAEPRRRSARARRRARGRRRSPGADPRRGPPRRDPRPRPPRSTARPRPRGRWQPRARRRPSAPRRARSGGGARSGPGARERSRCPSSRHVRSSYPEDGRTTPVTPVGDPPLPASAAGASVRCPEAPDRTSFPYLNRSKIGR